MKSITIIAAAAVFAAVSIGHAETVKKREQKEQNRIERGEEKGALTPKETQRLENEQKTIEDERQRALQDGKMSKRERQDIRHDQKRLSHDIHRKRHNEKREK